jgi:hypothetical protein
MEEATGVARGRGVSTVAITSHLFAGVLGAGAHPPTTRFTDVVASLHKLCFAQGSGHRRMPGMRVDGCLQIRRE